ncbi:MAG: oligopeptide/dipeptide ABC transporter ATP-binding protein [Chloroflexota bacterium]
MSPLISIEGASVTFTVRRGLFASTAVRAVREVSLGIERGEHVAIVGESGSGKSTLGRAVLRLQGLSAGRIVVDGAEIAGLRDDALRRFRHRVGAVFQDPYASLSPYMRVRDIVAEGLVIQGTVPSAEHADRVHAALEMVRLSPAAEIAERYPHTMSGGQRQRVAIARAMVLKPEILVADEPVSMVDASSRVEILGLLRELQAARGLTILSVTHDLASARHSADRIAVMYAGRIVEEGSAASVVGDPRHPYTRALLAAVPAPDAANRLRDRAVVPGEPPSPAALPSGCAFHPRCPVAIAGRCAADDPRSLPRVGGGAVACHLEADGG